MGKPKGITPKNRRRVCVWYQAEFLAARDDARTCSPRCRTAFSRNKTGSRPRPPNKTELLEELRLARLEIEIWQKVFETTAAKLPKVK